MGAPDVLIVGAGPAGACAGLVLARAGARVRIVDRARFPRDKLCGDTVNPGALARLRTLRVADEISRWPEADYVVIVAGQFDIVVEVVAATRRELLDLTNRMRALDGVVSTETFFYLEMWKQLYDWGTRGT